MRLGSCGARWKVGLPLALRKQLPVLPRAFALIALAVGSTFLISPFAVAQEQQDNMPPETAAPPVTPALRHSGPQTALHGLVYTTAGQQPGQAGPAAQSHRRGMPPNVVTPPVPSPQKPSPDKPEAAPEASETPEPASMLQLPANRAQVKLGDKGIAVQANNSSLSQVLRDIGTATGMKVEGLNRDERIFGNYGPAPPKDVLTALLDGAGYNVLMIGVTATGAPRQLILSQRNGSTTPAPAQVNRASDEDDAEPDPQEQETEVPPPPPVLPGINQRPNGAGVEGGVRTPQQLLEQLQKMHQDQPPPQQPPPQDLPPN